MTRTPLWTSITEALAAEIAGGQRRPGDKLPSEAELSQRFGVNRHTVRRALAELAARGLVHARRGAGVFVQEGRPVDYPIGRRTRLSRNLAAAGREAGRVVHLMETRRANLAEAEALDLQPGAPVHVVEGISTSDGLPIALFRSVLPAEPFPDMLAILQDTPSITEALRRQGVADYTRAGTRLTAKRATATMALHLRLREGDPILRTVSVNVDDAGRPVEYGHTWFAGDRITLTVTPD
ncbi:phosphonate metabolism transcriptional regulator PhnF [Falsirhodobacter sp. 20TX0035]|uniref:phosphonate metabolism transcriptional regulator PhnF n=1 Tax=Falsirhodobacter sp. 20TX0035 TaxID=3022019 RepID=UPI00232ED5B0|nr:phosphonate metabolism transcriptional regulator PhnF [Falsirhodobacter sp. 20TX0035]MDB6452720.1 phosphonate metabolism transcriptional regulator PhnF [Falsirhodobacter sp. 20TX0035]